MVDTHFLLYLLASRFIGLEEIPGKDDNPLIMAMLTLDNDWPEHDEVPWCSAFISFLAWVLRLPRSKSLRARSWLKVGNPTGEPKLGDIVVLKGMGDPNPEVLRSPGHVGIFVAWDINTPGVVVLGGNQDDTVSIKVFPIEDVLGYRDIISERS